MPIEPRDLLKQVAALKLISASAFDVMKSRLAGDVLPDSCEQVLEELVQQGKLTKFQAKALLQGKGAGLVLGNYMVLDKLGEGGMGIVFKAEHRRMQRMVALKVLFPKVSKQSNMIKRFRQEVRAVSRLMHPNIVTALDADEVGGLHFLVMEYVDGIDLKRLVDRSGAVSANLALKYLVQAARGLQHAHDAGVIHRDIKPSNLLLDRKGNLKVLDLGLARIEGLAGEESSEDQLTKTGIIMGSVDYMSPEQALDTKRVDLRSDIYSLGCTLYFLVAGKVLYPEDSTLKKILAHREKRTPSLREVAPEVPAELEQVYRKMVEKQVERRYQTMNEVVQAFESLLAGPGNRLGASSQNIAGEPGTDPLVAKATAERPSDVWTDDTLVASAPSIMAGDKATGLWGKTLRAGWVVASVLVAGIVLTPAMWWVSQWWLKNESPSEAIPVVAPKPQTTVHEVTPSSESDAPPIKAKADKEVQLNLE